MIFSGKQSGIVFADLPIPTKQFTIFLTFRVEDLLISETSSTSILYDTQQNFDEIKRKSYNTKLLNHIPIINHEYFGNNQRKSTYPMRTSIGKKSLSARFNPILFAFYTEDNAKLEMYIESTHLSRRLVLEVPAVINININYSNRKKKKNH